MNRNLKENMEIEEGKEDEEFEEGKEDEEIEEDMEYEEDEEIEEDIGNNRMIEIITESFEDDIINDDIVDIDITGIDHNEVKLEIQSPVVGNTVSTEERVTIIEDLVKNIKQIPDDSINNFFTDLQLFEPTTSIGNNLILILFYPPTNCMFTNESFGNKTGKLLTNYFDLKRLSLIDVIPYLHIEASGKFDQKMFYKLYITNTEFRNVLNTFVIKCLLLEIKMNKNKKFIVYLGGKVPYNIFWNCFNILIKSSSSLFKKLDDVNVGCDVILTPVEVIQNNNRTVLYTYKGIHPSAGMMNPQASELVRKDLLSLKVLNKIAEECSSVLQCDFIQECKDKFEKYIDVEDKEITEKYNKIKDYFITKQEILGIKLDKIIAYYPSFLYITSTNHIDCAVNVKISYPSIIGIKAVIYVLSGSIDCDMFLENLKDLLSNSIHNNLLDPAIKKVAVTYMLKLDSGLSILGSTTKYKMFLENLKDLLSNSIHNLLDPAIKKVAVTYMLKNNSGLNILGSTTNYNMFLENLKDLLSNSIINNNLIDPAIKKVIVTNMLKNNSGLSILGSTTNYKMFLENLSDAMEIGIPVDRYLMKNNSGISILKTEIKYNIFKRNIVSLGAIDIILVHHLLVKVKGGLPVLSSIEKYKALRDILTSKLQLPKTVTDYNDLISILRSGGIFSSHDSEDRALPDENLLSDNNNNDRDNMLIKNIIEEIKKLDPIEIVTRYSPTQEQLDDNRQQAKQRGIDTREAETKKIDDLNRLEGKEKLEEEQKQSILRALQSKKQDENTTRIQGITSDAWERAKVVSKPKNSDVMKTVDTDDTNKSSLNAKQSFDSKFGEPSSSNKKKKK